MGLTISAAILAGGSARRMTGVIKPNLKVGGETLISKILNVLDNIFEEKIIVTNTPEEFKCYTGCIIVTDQFIGRGPLGGIHAALKSSMSDSVFIFGGDMPLLDKHLIERQINLFRSLDCDILVPKIGDSLEPLHSVFRRSVLSDLEKYLIDYKDKSVRSFYKEVKTTFMELDDTEEIRHIFANINLHSDIDMIEKIIRKDKKQSGQK